MLAANPLIQVTPGLMIWTIVCFLVVLFVLKRFAFGPIQSMIDESGFARRSTKRTTPARRRATSSRSTAS
jgi:hypothetical protein